MVVVIRLAVLALVLSVGAVAEGAIDCRGTTPLPDDLTLVAPAADVPESLARFAGAWTGAWRDAGRRVDPAILSSAGDDGGP